MEGKVFDRWKNASNKQGRPLRVLFVHPAYPNTFVDVVDALARRPYLRCAYLVENRNQATVRANSPRVTCFGYDPDGIPHSDPAYPHTHAFERGARRGIGVARAIRKLYPEYTFDVIVGSGSMGCTLYLRGAVDSAIVSYCEHPGYFIQHARREFPPVFNQFIYDIGYRAMVLCSVAYSDLGLVASQHARSMFPPEFWSKVRVQSEGFNVPTPPDDIRMLREHLGLPGEGHLIAFIGRSLEAVRGFDIFLEVATRVRKARPDVNILVIGSEMTLYGNEILYLGETSFKRFALGQVRIAENEIIWRDFLPYNEYIAHLFCLDLAILPIFEGASNWSFFDTMACGVPIISSNRSYVPELIRDGQEGYLFDPYEVDSYVQATLTLLAHPAERKRIGQNARERVRQHYAAERAADGYERIIREAYQLRQQSGVTEAYL